MIVAGEPSGDLIGGRLMRALADIAPQPLRFVGVGGETMLAAGLEPLFPQSDIAVMGLAEVLSSVPRVWRRARTVARAAARLRPAALVTIDSAGFNKMVARSVARDSPETLRIHYVAPMVWAWRPGRVHAMARRFDHLLTLFAFEPPPFRAVGLAATWVGHPVVEAPPGNGPAFRERHGIPPEATVLCLLPGSRQGEVMRHLSIFRAAADRLLERHAGTRVVIPTIETLAGQVRAALAGWPAVPVIAAGEATRRDAFAAADVAIAASGTVALELALAGVPFVTAHRVHPVSAALARRLIRIPRVNLVNHLLGRALVPELLQQACSPIPIAAEVDALLGSPARRAAQAAGFRELRSALGPSAPPPSRRAAELVLDLVSGGRPGQTPTGITRGASP